jgi:predicted Zn-dependent protease
MRLDSALGTHQSARRRVALVLLAVLHVGLGPAALPDLAHTSPVFTASSDDDDDITESFEIAEPFDVDRGDFNQGLEVALAVAQEVGLEEDEATLSRIYDIGSRVALAADDASTVTTFYVVPMAEPNAFAVPGGFIFVTRGLLDTEIGDDALAHLLGHEITHVRNRHSSRMGTWSAVSSLLHTALLIGLAVGAGAAGGGQTHTVDEYGIERVSLDGSTAVFQGASVFGSVFRELFLRGFSRRLETEADEEGYRLATRAGYAPLGGVELLETLHQRIYEQSSYGYWRTHPYFVDRVAGARARAGKRVPGPDSSRVAEYRLRAQATLVGEARRHEGGAGDVLYRTALRAGPGKAGTGRIELELARLRSAREREKPVLARELGPIVTAADTAIARLERSGAPAGDLDPLIAERDELRDELDDQMAGAVKVIDTPGAASNATLETFLLNYPHHPRAPEVQLALARRHLRAEDPEVAIPLLMAMIENPTASDSLLQAGRSELARAIVTTKDLSACYSVVASPPDSILGAQAEVRMETLVAEVDSLENGGRFLKRWPDTPYSERVRERVSALATDSARFARVFEVGGKPQEALDLYNRVVLLAPGTEAAGVAMRGIERIQGVESS